MKKYMLALIMLFFFAGMISAQPGPPSKEKLLRHLKNVLQLNDSQADKVKSILASFEPKMNELHQKMEAARKKEMEDMEKLRSDQEDQISQILNDDQRKKFNEMSDMEGMPPRPEMMGKKHGNHEMRGPGCMNEPPGKENRGMHGPDHEQEPHDLK
jgi:hypothetical protein